LGFFRKNLSITLFPLRIYEKRNSFFKPVRLLTGKGAKYSPRRILTITIGIQSAVELEKIKF